MIYCVSGLGGFIGSHLKRMLETRGDKVVRITQELLYQPDLLKTFFEKEQPDYIINLMSYGNHSNQTDGNMAILANIIGATNMLSASLTIPYKGFVQVGTSSEYGISDMPMREKDALDPLTFYAAAKASATMIARVFARQYAKPIVIVRPFSVYGEGEAEFRFIPTIIRSLIQNKEMELDTKPVHDWIYVDDFITGMLTAMEHAKSGEIVNIGTGREVSNQQMVNVLQNIANKQLKYKEAILRPFDTPHWSANIAKLMGYGWRAKFPLGIGLGKVYEYYKAQYSN